MLQSILKILRQTSRTGRSVQHLPWTALFYLSPFFVLCAGKIISEEPHHTTAYINTPCAIDVLLAYSTYQTTHFWNQEGEKLPTYDSFQDSSYLLYVEYAWNRRNSVSVNGGYSLVKESLNGSSYGVKDVEIGWKHLIRKGATSALTLQLIGIVPASDKKSSIRYGQPGAQISLLYSDIFCLKKWGWYDLDIGYRHYQGFPSSQFLASAAIGYWIFSRFYLLASAQLDYGVWNGKANYNVNNVVFHPNYRLFKGQIEGVAEINAYASLVLGAFRHLWGMNTGTGGGYFGGAWFNF